LTQERFANALAKQSKNKALDKAVVSKWESDVTTNPNNASMLAIQAVTGFSLQWLIHGTGEMRVATEATPDLHQESLERAILAVFPNAQTEEVRAVSALYSLVVDAPDVSDVSLARTAAAILKS
jgi:phage repressor protein C with HTH and peptisase S24 domain